jgi:crossover junction endodeoxyribonuclease RuvC
MTIGIDPGTATVGYAICQGNRFAPEILDYGVLHTDPLPEDMLHFRLLELGNDLENILQKYKPDRAVIEELFFFKNLKTAISVAQSRGMIIYLLAKYKIEVVNMTPLELKQQLCGYGRAPKKQVQEMVKKVYHLDKIPKPDDAADALALAWLGL